MRSASTRLEAALGETLLGDFTANAYVVIVLSSARQQNLGIRPYNEELVVTNDLLHPSNGTYYGKGLHVTNHRYSKHILPVSWSFVSERTFSLTFPSMPTPASAA